MGKISDQSRKVSVLTLKVFGVVSGLVVALWMVGIIHVMDTIDNTGPGKREHSSSISVLNWSGYKWGGHRPGWIDSDYPSADYLVPPNK